MTQKPDDEGLNVDFGLVRSILRRRFRTLLIVAVIVFLVFVGAGLFLLPQSYTSVVSLSVQQPTSFGGGLANLIGLGTTQTKYLGIIRSRRLASTVEDKVHLQQIYGLPTRDEAVKRIMKSVQPDDNTVDGLLYIRVTLKGPPRIAADPKGLRPKLKQAAAEIANAYAEALRNYYKEIDNDRDAVLQRTVDSEVKLALNEYQMSWRDLRGFVARQPTGIFLDDTGVSGSGSAMTAQTLSELFGALARVEADIQAVKKTRETLKKKRADLLKNIDQVPSDDSFLKEARENYRTELRNLQNLQVKYAADHPLVVEAQGRVKIARERLDKEQEGIREGHTSDVARADADLEGLTARHEVVRQQLIKALEHSQLSREKAVEFRRLQNALALSFELLKTAVTQAATVRSQTASSESRVLVVDSGLPPKTGTPSLLMIFVISLFGAIVVPFVVISPEYMIRSRSRGTAINA